jgi:ribonuclease T2
MIRVAVRVAAVAAFLLSLTISNVTAQDRRQNEPGKFDFYVLSLTWSPSFCAAAADRGRPSSSPQCGERPASFVVHGLWPQYEAGFPEYCQVPAPRLERAVVSSVVDLMPNPRLIFRQWGKHGTCTGLSARAYFEGVRQARAVVKIPERFLDLKETLTVSPGEVEDAFVAANSGLQHAGLAVRCDSKRITEVRICLTREFQFRDCGEVDRRACRREQVAMPPVGGS